MAEEQARVAGETPQSAQGADSSPVRGAEEEPEITGRYAQEKRRIHKRLKTYRMANGLGSFRKLADVTNGAVSEDAIREIFCGVKTNIQVWRIVDAALDHLAKTN